MDNANPLIRQRDTSNWPLWLKAAFGEIGVHELSGPDQDNGKILDYMRSLPGPVPFPHLHDEIAWCLTGDAELLTERGWLAFAALDTQTQVAQVDPTSLEITLTPPIALIRKQYAGPLVTIDRRSLRLHMDPDHRLFGTWRFGARRSQKQDWPDRELHPISELVSGAASVVTVPVPHSGRPDLVVPDRDVRLLGAFIADGFSHGGRIEFQVSRDWKVRLLKSLEPSHVHLAPRAYGPRTKLPLVTVQFEVPPVFSEAFASYKVLRPEFVWSLSARQAGLLLDTMAYVDGSQRGDHVVLTQSVKARVDVCHHLAVLAGWSGQTRDGGPSGEFGSRRYSLSYERRGLPTRVRSDQVSTAVGDAPLFCVQVPTGLIVVRPPYGRAMVIGNCAAFVNWSLTQVGLEGSGKWNARSYLTWGVPSPLVTGAIVVLLRGGNAWQGHVGFCVSSSTALVELLAGNQGNAVSIASFQRSRIVGVRFPS